MLKTPERKTSEAEWELERIQQHVGKAMAAIAAGHGIEAAAPHLAAADEALLRAFPGQQKHPVVQGLAKRLGVIRGVIAAHAKGATL